MQTHRFVLLATAATLLALPSWAGPSDDGSGEAEPPPRAEIRVEVGGLRSEEGILRCALFRTALGFPMDPQRAVAHLEEEPSTEGVVCLFPEVEAGTYAVSVHHDEDGDGRMKVIPPGIPVEGRGASNNPDIRRAPPRFDDAALEVDGEDLTLSVEVVY